MSPQFLHLYLSYSTPLSEDFTWFPHLFTPQATLNTAPAKPMCLTCGLPADYPTWECGRPNCTPKAKYLRELYLRPFGSDLIAHNWLSYWYSTLPQEWRTHLYILATKEQYNAENHLRI